MNTPPPEMDDRMGDGQGGGTPQTATVRKIVVGLQRGIPLTPRPFQTLANDLGVNADTCLDVATRMIADGSARRVGAVFDARRLGYRSELWAASVPENCLDEAGDFVAAQAGVTHAYQRGVPAALPAMPEVAGVRHPMPNLWFTLAVLHDRFDAAAAELQTQLTPFEVLRLPARRRFKIDVIFDPRQRDAAERIPGPDASAVSRETRTDVATLSAADRALVRGLQGHNAVVPDFFAAMAERVGWKTDMLLERLRDWQQTGTLRRMAMIVRHRRIGFTANAMCVWPVAEADPIKAGRRLATWNAVTHCYARVTRKGWPFTLYAMIHTAEWTATHALFERLSADAQLPAGALLGSLREFKKTSMRYFADDDT